MKNLIIVLVALGPAAAASAQFYGGDPDGENGLSSEKNTMVSDGFTYDNFHWAGGPVGTVFGSFKSDLAQIAGGEWEIRSGMSVGNGGVIVLSGSTVTGWWPTGGFGAPYVLEMDGGNQDLAEGDYWVGVRPIGFGQGRAFVCTTEGAFGIGGPLNDDNSFFNSTFYGVNFGEASDYVGVGQADFTYGVTTATCYADCDRSGELDIDDFICFQSLFGLGDLGADCDSSGELDIDDFICFQTVFAAGCP